MRKSLFACLACCLLCANGFLAAQNFGIGQPTPSNKLDVNGNLSVGSGFSGTATAPANGALIEGRVGLGTATPNPNAQLDVSSTTRGLLAPRMSTAQRTTLGGSLAGSDAAMMVYDTNDRQYYFWDGTRWNPFATDTLWDKTGNALFSQDPNARVGLGTTTPNANAILDLSTNNRGLLGPRLTTAQRTALGSAIGTAEQSMLVYDTDEGAYF
jgi:hypothetical protein